MASALQRILLKRSAVANKQPQFTDLMLGELAIDTGAGRLYWKSNNGGTDVLVEAATKSYTASTYVTQNPTISPGTATKISYSSNGLVIGGTTLTVSDLPSIPWSQITSGSTPTTLNGYGITDAQHSLGYIPVQQGYGSYPSTNVVYIGYDSNATQLTLKVNTGDFGNTWPINISGSAASSIPAGSIMYFATSNPPSGWLVANGATVNVSTYYNLYQAIGGQFNIPGNVGPGQFGLPDLRGVFIRGWDAGRGADPSRAFGSYQADMFGSHNHTVSGYALIQGSGPIPWYNWPPANGTYSYNNPYTSSSGGSETTPKNVALLACIKY